MTVIKITPFDNGAHANQMIYGATPETFPLPEDWAVLSEGVGRPETLEHFPFGAVTVAEVDGVPTVTSWTPLPVPEPPLSVRESTQEADTAS